MNGDSNLTPTDGLDPAELEALSAFVDGELPEAARSSVADRI